MSGFSKNEDRDENIGEIVLECLVASRIDSIEELNLAMNDSWFKNPFSRKERPGNTALLAELLSKQAGLMQINLGGNEIIDKFYGNAFSSAAT